MRKLIIFLALAFLLAPAAMAVDVGQSQSDALKAEDIQKALPDNAKKNLAGITVTNAANVSGGLGKVLAGAAGQAAGIAKTSLRSAAVILTVVVLCSVVCSIFDGGASKYTVLVGVLAIAAVSAGNIGSFIGLGKTTMDELDAFAKVLMPTLTAAAVSSGAITSAAAKYAAAVLFMNVLMTASEKIVIPLIYAYTAASIAEAALGGEGLSSASGLLKWLARSVLSVIMLAFIAYISLTGIISGSSDAAAVRATKVTIQTTLPVVGNIIADASETVLSGAAILRNSVGVYGMLAVVSICLVPFLRLGANYILYKAAGGLAGTIADSRITKLIGAISTAFGIMMGLVGSSAIILFVAIISVIRVVA